MTHDLEPCQLVPNMANDSSKRALPHWLHVYCSQIKKDRQNLTLMTHEREPRQFGPNMANDSSIRALPHWQPVYSSQIKKRQAHDRGPRQLVANMANDSSILFKIYMLLLK